jgi:hypothetical protein
VEEVQSEEALARHQPQAVIREEVPRPGNLEEAKLLPVEFPEVPVGSDATG